jgi:hypothetical protein
MTDIVKVAAGMSIVGQALTLGTPEEAQVATWFLMGNYDSEVKTFLYWKEKNSFPTTDADLDIPSVVEKLEFMKGVVRRKIQNIFHQAEAEDREEKQRHHLNLINQMRQSNKPHHLGTVDEIAKRFNISKSQVRRLKADNALDAFADAASAMQSNNL